MARFWVRRRCSSLLLKRIVFAMRVSTRKRSASWALRHWQDRACSRVPPLHPRKAAPWPANTAPERLPRRLPRSLRHWLRGRWRARAPAKPPLQRSQHRHLVCPRATRTPGPNAAATIKWTSSLAHRLFRQSLRVLLTRRDPYEISRQDSADLAAFARETGPLTVQTIASGDDLSEYPDRIPAGSPTAAEPTVARNLLQLIGAAFDKRVLLVQPRANNTWSAATKPDRANTILINTRKGDPLLALIGHEFGHNLRAQRPDLDRAFSYLALATNPVPFNYGIDPADPSNTGSERISSVIPALVADHPFGLAH